MATVVGRNLSAAGDIFDSVSIKVDTGDYVGKTGCLQLTVSTVDVGTSNTTNAQAGKVNLFPSGYIDTFDTQWLTNYSINNVAQTINVTKTYNYSVNNGVFGPSALYQPDGTVDLMVATFLRNDEASATGMQLTINYTLSFADLSYTGIGDIAITDSPILHLYPDQLNNKVVYGKSITSLGELSGYVVCQIRNISYVTVQKSILNYGQPYLIANHANKPVFGHYLSTASGTKIYPSYNRAVFAINQGKGDANTFPSPGSVPSTGFLQFSLLRQPDWPSDNEVTVTVNYGKSEVIA